MWASIPLFLVVGTLCLAAATATTNASSSWAGIVQGCRYDTSVQFVIDHELEKYEPSCLPRDLGCLAYHIARRNWTTIELTQTNDHTGAHSSSGLDPNTLDAACGDPVEDARTIPLNPPVGEGKVKEVVVLQRMYKASSSSLTCVASLLGPASGHAYVDLYAKHDEAVRAQHAASTGEQAKEMGALLRSYVKQIHDAEQRELEDSLLMGGEGRFVLSGHVPFVPHLALSDQQPFVKTMWVTMLRRPVDRLRSMYLWKTNAKSMDPLLHLELKRREEAGVCGCGGGGGEGLAFEVCLQSLADQPSCRQALPFNTTVLLAESPVVLLCGTQDCLAPDPATAAGVPSSAALNQALQNMRTQYHAVGLTEHFELSLELFACQMPAFFGLLGPSEGSAFPARERWISYAKREMTKNKQDMPSSADDAGRTIARAREQLPAFNLLLQREEAVYKEAKRKFNLDLQYHLQHGTCELSAMGFESHPKPTGPTSSQSYAPAQLVLE